MIVHKPAKLLLVGLIAVYAMAIGLSFVLSDAALTAFTVVGTLGVMFGVGIWCWLTDGEPPTPISHQLQVREREVIDVRSQRVS